MATYFYGVNIGAGINPAAITEQATTTGKDVEVVINTTANVPNKEQLALAVQSLQDYIMGQAAKNF
jgi:predicted nuclease of predicted toxin-antitoxin system